MFDLLAQTPEAMDWFSRLLDMGDRHGPFALILFVLLGLVVWGVRVIWSTFAPPAVDALKGHVGFLKTSTETMAGLADTVKAQGDDHNRTHRALRHLGSAVGESVDDAKRHAVRPHIDAMRESLE